MKFIKSIHRHGSESILLFTKDHKSLETYSVTKSSTTKRGINAIISEYEGINWYNQKSENKIICNLEKNYKTYYKIKINFNKGFFNLKSDISYLKIQNYLDLTLNHYLKVWRNYKNQKYAPFHGDLSLVGNVMFNNKNEVLFVDWEQFDNNLKMPTGIDPIITIIENVWYETLRSKRIDKKILLHVQKYIKSLNKAGLLSSLLKEKPAQNTIDYIKSNLDIWKGQHFKLPVLKISKQYIVEIDNAVIF